MFNVNVRINRLKDEGTADVNEVSEIIKMNKQKMGNCTWEPQSGIPVHCFQNAGLYEEKKPDYLIT